MLLGRESIIYNSTNKLTHLNKFKRNNLIKMLSKRLLSKKHFNLLEKNLFPFSTSTKHSEISKSVESKSGNIKYFKIYRW